MGASFVGVDGCPKGRWFAVAFPKLGPPSLAVYENAEALWRAHADAEVICIDSPIGLRDEGDIERLCDTEARDLLGQRRSSVFYVPCRKAVCAATRKKACEVNKRLTGGKGVPTQSWGIVPRIRELDELLRRDERARATVREVHPELCFWAFAGGRPMTHHKSTEQGYLERANLLEHVHPRAYDIIAEALDAFPRSAVARDDVVDALAAAVTALAGRNALATLPKNPETDSEGLPMQMVYSPQFIEFEWA